jgi:hypothetical protein
METGAEKGADTQTEPNPQADMWQFKKFHIPQRKKTLLKILGQGKVLHNQTATHTKRRT